MSNKGFCLEIKHKDGVISNCSFPERYKTVDICNIALQFVNAYKYIVNYKKDYQLATIRALEAIGGYLSEDALYDFLQTYPMENAVRWSELTETTPIIEIATDLMEDVKNIQPTNITINIKDNTVDISEAVVHSSGFFRQIQEAFYPGKKKDRFEKLQELWKADQKDAFNGINMSNISIDDFETVIEKIDESEDIFLWGDEMVGKL